MKLLRSIAKGNTMDMRQVTTRFANVPKLIPLSFITPDMYIHTMGPYGSQNIATNRRINAT